MRLRFNTVLTGLLLVSILSIAGSASARTFSGNIQAVTGFGLPIPILNPISVVPNATVPTTPPVTAMGPIVIPAVQFFLSTGPNVFPLPQPTSYPFLTSTTFATFSNDAGGFASGAGPGTFTFCPGLGVGPCTNNQGTKPGRLRVDNVTNQFGGIMRLAGVFNDVLNIQSGGGVLRGTLPIPLSGVGGSIGETVMATGTFSHSTQGFTTLVSGTVSFAPWTTARFRVDDSVGVQASAQTATGYDLRNSTGAGNIQLVTGWLAHVNGLAADDTIGQAVMNVNVPEPASVLALGTGLSLLGLLYRSSRKD